MSNALAIATVTQTLYQVLTDALPASLVGGARVTVLRPDAADLPTPGVNIFLYQVTPNTAWRNADLPTRKGDASLRRRPQLALDLHYLISFYGADATCEPQRLLGAVARALHAAPTLDPALLQATEDQVDSASGKRIFDSNLSSQVDLVRFTPTNFSLEEMSKLWSVFLKTDSVLSLAYAAGVVLLETDDPAPATALPVWLPRVQAVGLGPAVIAAVVPSVVAPGAGAASVTLQGQGLANATAAVFTTPGGAAPLAGNIAPGSTAGEMTVLLPSGLRPGVNAVQLTQSAAAASPPDTTPLVLSRSNAAAFVVQPVLLHLAPASSPPGSVTAVISPPAGAAQQVSLVLTPQDGSPPGANQALVLAADPRSGDSDTFSFGAVLADGTLLRGSYLARVQVDTAESPLTVDASGKFNGPLVHLP